MALPFSFALAAAAASSNTKGSSSSAAEDPTLELLGELGTAASGIVLGAVGGCAGRSTTLEATSGLEGAVIASEPSLLLSEASERTAGTAGRCFKPAVVDALRLADRAGVLTVSLLVSAEGIAC